MSSTVHASQSGVSDDINNKSIPGGYAAMLHEVIEEKYGPNSPYPPYCRVFEFILHQLIRNWSYQRAVSRNDIKKATGVHDDRNLSRILKQLEKDKMILSFKTKTGNVWNETEYTLHPDRFGKNYIWKNQKTEKAPHFTVHEGGKNASQKDTGGTASQTQEGTAPKTGGVPSSEQHKTAEDPLWSPMPGYLKNPFKEPVNKEPYKNEDKNFQFSNETGSGNDWVNGVDLSARRQLLSEQMRMLKSGLI